MNSHDPHNVHGSHDPDFPQDPSVIPDAETATASGSPPGAAAAGESSAVDALQESSVMNAGMATGGAVDLDSADPISLMDPLGSVPSTDGAWAADPPDPAAFRPEAATPELSDPVLTDPGLSVPGASGSETPPRPNPSVVQATEVWTELDEAEPTALVEAISTESGAVSALTGETKGDEPADLDAGSRSRREAETPSRTVLPYDDWEPSEVPFQPKELGILDQLMVVLAEGMTRWRRLLRQVRSWLPRTWQRNLSDELMTALALGLLILWLVLWNPLGRGGSAPGGVVEDAGRPSPSLSSGDTTRTGSALSPGSGGEVAPAVTAENPPEALEPSPEQTLIADIQERVSKISRAYAVGLIQSVEVNWPQQVLAVNVSQDWYGLGSTTQDRIAQDIYGQTQGLALATLQLRDPDGVVVARNPVVGPAMVILKRHRPAEGDPLA